VHGFSTKTCLEIISSKNKKLTKTTRKAPSGAHARETFLPYLLNELSDRVTTDNLLAGCKRIHIGLFSTEVAVLRRSHTDSNTPNFERPSLQDSKQSRSFVEDQIQNWIFLVIRRCKQSGWRAWEIHLACQDYHISVQDRVWRSDRSQIV
jgi:hypothetical protein